MQQDKGWRLWTSKQQRHKQLRFSFQTWVRPGLEAPASLPAATRAQHDENQVHGQMCQGPSLLRGPARTQFRPSRGLRVACT